MKVNVVLLVAIAAATQWNAAPVNAAESFTEARVTRLEKDVKILKEGAAPRTAAVGDAVSAVSSVATGAGSRAELQFPDKSLTRLGANSRLTIRGDERTLDLDQGVVFLQVPKQMGGAKLRTGAVTAAVTGTTVILEALPGNDGAVKLIVIEGTVDLFKNNKPSVFSTINAGEIVMLKKNDLNIPLGTPIDVKLMLKTGNKFFQEVEGTPNAAQIQGTVQLQQQQIATGVLQNTNVIILGRGHIAHVVDHPSNVAHNAMLVHAVNNNGGGKNNKFLNLLGPGNNGLGALNGNGNGNGKGFGQGNGNGKGKGNGNGNAFGQGNGPGQGGNKGKGNAGGNGNGNGNAGGNGNGGGGGGGASANSNKGGGGPPANVGGGPPGGPPGGGPKKK